MACPQPLEAGAVVVVVFIVVAAGSGQALSRPDITSESTWKGAKDGAGVVAFATIVAFAAKVAFAAMVAFADVLLVGVDDRV